MSFGSIIQPGKMSDEMKMSLVKGFSKIGLTVLWRWKGKPMTNLPTNIIQRSWLPQQAILGEEKYQIINLRMSRAVL